MYTLARAHSHLPTHRHSHIVSSFTDVSWTVDVMHAGIGHLTFRHTSTRPYRHRHSTRQTHQYHTITDTADAPTPGSGQAKSPRPTPTHSIQSLTTNHGDITDTAHVCQVITIHGSECTHALVPRNPVDVHAFVCPCFSHTHAYYEGCHQQ